MKVTVLMTVEYSVEIPVEVLATSLMRCKEDLEDDLALHGAIVKIARVHKLQRPEHRVVEENYKATEPYASIQDRNAVVCKSASTSSYPTRRDIPAAKVMP